MMQQETEYSRQDSHPHSETDMNGDLTSHHEKGHIRRYMRESISEQASVYQHECQKVCLCFSFLYCPAEAFVFLLTCSVSYSIMLICRLHNSTLSLIFYYRLIFK